MGIEKTGLLACDHINWINRLIANCQSSISTEGFSADSLILVLRLFLQITQENNVRCNQ